MENNNIPSSANDFGSNLESSAILESEILASQME